MPTATHIAYLHLCHRKLWLFANGIQMEHNSELVGEGKLIEEQAYKQRANRWKELQIDNIKLDHYDPHNGIIREVKKSNKREYAHIAQVKYYLYTLRKHGIKADHAILEYPRLRETEKVCLHENEITEISNWEQQVNDIVNQVTCPPILAGKSLCKRCAYYDFCFVGELPIKIE